MKSNQIHIQIDALLVHFQAESTVLLREVWGVGGHGHLWPYCDAPPLTVRPQYFDYNLYSLISNLLVSRAQGIFDC